MPATSIRIPQTAPHLYAPGARPSQVVAGELAVHRHLAPEQQLRVAAGHEAHDEGSELVGLVGDDLDGEVAEPVQPHEVAQGRGAIRLGFVAAGQCRRIDGVIEVRVADEHSRHASGRARVAVEHRLVGHRQPAQQQGAQGHARHVRVDEQRDPLVGQPVAGHPEPGQLEPGGQIERDRLQLTQRLGVVDRRIRRARHQTAAYGRALVRRSSTRPASGMLGLRHTCRCSKGQA